MHHQKPQPLVAQRHLLQEQGIIGRHPKLRKLEPRRARLVGRSRRPRSHMDGHRNVQFFSQLPIRLKAVVPRRHAEELRDELARALTVPARSCSLSHGRSTRSPGPSQHRRPTKAARPPGHTRTTDGRYWLTSRAVRHSPKSEAKPERTTKRTFNDRIRAVNCGGDKLVLWTWTSITGGRAAD